MLLSGKGYSTDFCCINVYISSSRIPGQFQFKLLVNLRLKLQFWQRLSYHWKQSWTKVSYWAKCHTLSSSHYCGIVVIITSKIMFTRFVNNKAIRKAIVKHLLKTSRTKRTLYVLRIENSPFKAKEPSTENLRPLPKYVRSANNKFFEKNLFRPEILEGV